MSKYDIQPQCEEQHGTYAAEPADESYWERNDISVGWPGDGSGMDDFQDLNQNEAYDYSNE